MSILPRTSAVRDLKTPTRLALIVLAAFGFASPVVAIDPPYQRQMERLSEVMGSLYLPRFVKSAVKTGVSRCRS
jgi:predicted secreted protein